jgi:hypothetical protein
LDWESKPGERYSDTVQRMLYERTQKIQALTQENDRLKGLIDKDDHMAKPPRGVVGMLSPPERR